MKFPESMEGSTCSYPRLLEVRRDPEDPNECAFKIVAPEYDGYEEAAIARNGIGDWSYGMMRSVAKAMVECYNEQARDQLGFPKYRVPKTLEVAIGIVKDHFFTELKRDVIDLYSDTGSPEESRRLYLEDALRGLMGSEMVHVSMRDGDFVIRTHGESIDVEVTLHVPEDPPEEPDDLS